MKRNSVEIMDHQETCEDGMPEYRRPHGRDCEIVANAHATGKQEFGIRFYSTLLLLMLAGY